MRLGALASASGDPLAGGLKGIEKESLRIDASGNLSRTVHPVALGSALTNRFITTDFSEALLEFITPAFVNTWESLHFLCDVHQFTYERLDDELLWIASMPCRVPVDALVPLARYGTSNVGQMKTIYRRGLGYRYGRHMQTIAGVHFNYSLPDRFWLEYREVVGDRQSADQFRSEQYLGLVRNFRRFGWLVLYLCGASPAICKSFAADADVKMPALNKDTWYEPYGTSLRMSDLGYSNQNQARINISLNSLDEYIRDLDKAIRTPEPAYKDIGVKVDGKYRQLNTNRLQIENEYYSPVRPKRVARSGERPTAALRRDGIEYIEIRSLDINVNDPAGINQNTMRFVEAFLIYCLVEDSPPLDDRSLRETRRNHTGTATHGRDPEFRLQRGSDAVALDTWAGEILANVLAIAELIDAGEGGDSYVQAVRMMQSMVDYPDTTPSARLLDELRDANCGFFDFALSVSQGHRDYFASIPPLSEERQRQFDIEVARSLAQQSEIEASDKISLDDYLAAYFSAD
ncbi:MAG: glutamate--cysteine ligase [Proteobacteria bacterium]|nr:glutamate--cysteine ligase [Pseudomonadota bacterium]